jgi:hypothetical protein
MIGAALAFCMEWGLYDALVDEILNRYYDEMRSNHD